jgi:hypothetical protein
MTNRELLAAAREQLGPAARQRQWLLRVQQTAVPCPACSAPLDAFQAAGVDVDAFDFTQAPAYRCPRCHAELERESSYIPAFPGWSWRLKPAWLAERLRRADAYDRLHQSQEET